MDEYVIESSIDSMIGSAIEEAKANIAFAYQETRELVQSDDGRIAKLPIEISKFLISEPGIIYHGFTDIINTSFIIICEKFEYVLEIDRSSDHTDLNQNVSVDIGINYDTIKEYRAAIKIDEYNQACYQNRQVEFIKNIKDELRNG